MDTNRTAKINIFHLNGRVTLEERPVTIVGHTGPWTIVRWIDNGGEYTVLPEDITEAS